MDKSQLKLSNMYHIGVGVESLKSRVAILDTIENTSGSCISDFCEEYETRNDSYNTYYLEMDGYFLSYFMSILQSSKVYRVAFCKRHTGLDTLPDENILWLIIQLKSAVRHYIDRIGNGIVLTSVNEKIETEHALSWLSTLGGAFSALGDLSESFALEAGKVSVAQLRIAIMMGDPLIASRCRLYAAISLLQQGHLNYSRSIILREFAYANSLPPGFDPRLRRMCLGIWAKLKYYYSLRKKNRHRDEKKNEKRHYVSRMNTPF